MDSFYIPKHVPIKAKVPTLAVKIPKDIKMFLFIFTRMLKSTSSVRSSIEGTTGCSTGSQECVHFWKGWVQQELNIAQVYVPVP